MQEQKFVEVTINPDGTTSIDAIGFHGTGCKDMVGAFGDALGSAIEETEKPEYSEVQVNRNLVSTSN
jgi:hypothetical protein